MIQAIIVKLRKIKSQYFFLTSEI